MKTLNYSSIALMAALCAAPAFAAEFTIDQSHSHVGFKVRHLVSKVDGEFKDFDGAFTFDEKDADKAKVKFTAKATSINTGTAKRDEHLRSPDFFDVKKYPTLSFEGKKLETDGDKHYKLAGDLTIHGVTKPTTFDVDFGGVAKDPWGGTRAGFTATTKINRKDFGLTWNKALETGGLLVGDDVTIELNIEGVAKK